MNYQSYNHQRRKERFENRYESLLLERYGEGSKLSAACNLIRVLLKSWRSEADARGQLFLVALLPNKTPSINALIKTELDNLEVKYIDLFPFFVERQRESSKKNTIILNDKQVLKQFSLRILKHVKGKDASEGQTTQTNKIKETIQNLFYLIESHPDKEEIINLIDKSNQKKRKMAPGLTHLLENGKEERIIELIEGLIKRGQINEKYFFNTDKHWNEEGNKIASVFLMKFLAETLNLVEVDDQFIRCGLNEYYSSFDPKTDSGLWLEEGMIPEYLKRSIQQKYLSLEQYIAEATQ